MQVIYNDNVLLKQSCVASPAISHGWKEDLWGIRSLGEDGQIKSNVDKYPNDERLIEMNVRARSEERVVLQYVIVLEKMYDAKW